MYTWKCYAANLICYQATHKGSILCQTINLAYTTNLPSIPKLCNSIRSWDSSIPPFITKKKNNTQKKQPSRITEGVLWIPRKTNPKGVKLWLPLHLKFYLKFHCWSATLIILVILCYMQKWNCNSSLRTIFWNGNISNSRLTYVPPKRALS